MLTVSNNNKTLLKDGKPFFYLADTCWSAFTNIENEDWIYYLYKRKVQGFNTIQINILPQWDASSTNLNYWPFVDKDPYKLDNAYFTRAREMVKTAKEKGFEVALVVLWCNYVPGTWASKLFPTGILPFDCLENYVNKVHETFSDLHPIYVVTGDTDFQTEETEKYYISVGKQLKALAKDCLFTTHIKGRYSYIPEELASMLDLFFYQSGHNSNDLTMPYSLSEEMQAKYPDKPLLNSEPCYEDMGYSGGKYGRWTRRDVRRAAYVSILSGACAGITYGAAGIYSWHKATSSFAASLGEGFDMPKCIEEAMNFPGAWDYGYLKTIFEQLGVDGITSAQELLVNKTTDIRLAYANENLLLVYLPSNTCVRLNKDFTDWKVDCIDLENRFTCKLNITYKKEQSVIDMHPFKEDVLYIIRK